MKNQETYHLGDYWHKEMMTLPKEFIIGMLKSELEKNWQYGGVNTQFPM
ncbi:MAG: hypothetical protein AB3N16_07515 [Flavobacteriaceae bacterium]